MDKIVGFGLIAFGVVVLALGISEGESFGSELSKFFTGKPTDRSLWMTLGGALSIAVGAGTLFFSGPRPAGGGRAS